LFLIGTGEKYKEHQTPRMRGAFCLTNMIIDNHNYFKRYCTNCGFMHAIRLKCSDRFCPLCCKADYKRLYDKYLPLIKESEFLFHLTLTHKNKKFLNGNIVQKLLQDFNAFRKDAYIKRRIRGGLSVIECVHKDDSKGWNLHMHCLMDGDYIDQDYISKLWLSITGDSSIVHIKAVSDRYKKESRALALHYLLKYVLKPPHVEGSCLEDLKADYNSAFYRTRHIVAYGSFYDASFSLEDGVLGFDLVCPVCGGTEWITEFDLLCMENMAYRPG
jgi:hypothetical protein